MPRMKPLAHEIILASAGSGKTYQLTNRFVRLLALGVPPEKIIALTFTRKAAGEFLDAILDKLAGAAAAPSEAADLSRSLGDAARSQEDFAAMLRSVLDVSHRLSLTTLDSFFVRVARGLPLELGLGGDLEILASKGHVDRARRDVYRSVFEQVPIGSSTFENFQFALREASFGDEELAVLPLVDSFVSKHHSTVLSVPAPELWGSADVIWPEGCPFVGLGVDEFRAALTRFRKALEGTDLTSNAREKAGQFFVQAQEWTWGTEIKAPMSSVVKNLLANVHDLQRGSATFSFCGKKLDFDGPLAEAAFATIAAYIGSEISARTDRTKALYGVLSAYESSHDKTLRRRGRFSFEDLTVVLRSQMREREGIGAELAYRLDGSFDHWLLDEFQDTSRRQWDVLRPLVDEVVHDASGTRTYFQVGDVKQSIYGWRGGDPTLIRDIRSDYAGMFHERQLTRSFRSVPAVLDAVNRVFGDPAGLASLGFVPEAAIAQMEWEDHAPSTATGDGQGHACFRQTPQPKGPDEDVYALALEIVREVQPLERGLSCAIICEGNAKVRAVVDYFRAQGFTQIVSGSKVKPAVDNPVTLALLALFRFAAFPGDGFARGQVEMSPLAGAIASGWPSTHAAGVDVLAQIGARGFAATVEAWAGKLPAMGEFARHRLDTLVEIARAYDAGTESGVPGFLEFAESYETEELPGDGVVQVMTIHASKGLGFDVVLLPELEGKKALASLRDGLVVAGRPGDPEWVLDMPKKDIAEADPTLAAECARLAEAAGFESLCKWYVAMTRAKRGLYLVSRPRPETSKAKNALALFHGMLGEGYESGTADWFEGHPVQPPPAGATPCALRETIATGPPPRAAARTASSTRTFSSAEARGYGSRVHDQLAGVEWEEAGEARHPAFVRPPGDVVLWREKRFECVIDGVWVSGVFDRVVVEPAARKATVYEFKTGDTRGAGAQLDLYCSALRTMFPGFQVQGEVVPASRGT